MFCTNCGRQNDERASFCEYCGRSLNTPAAEYSGNQPQYGYSTPTPQYSAQNPYSPSAPLKKNRKGLLLVILIASVVVISAIAVMLFVSTASPVVGTWYSESRGTVLEFRKNGIVVSRTVNGRDEGSYSYSAQDESGVITADKETYEFSLEDDWMDVDGIGKFKKADQNFDIQEFIDQYHS